MSRWSPPPVLGQGAGYNSEVVKETIKEKAWDAWYDSKQWSKKGPCSAKRWQHCNSFAAGQRIPSQAKHGDQIYKLQLAAEQHSAELHAKYACCPINKVVTGRTNPDPQFSPEKLPLAPNVETATQMNCHALASCAVVGRGFKNTIFTLFMIWNLLFS